MRHTKEFLSNQRQKLSQDADNKDKEALGLERKSYLLESERISNLNKANILREESSKCRQALQNLRSGTKAQKLAGFGR